MCTTFHIHIYYILYILYNIQNMILVPEEKSAWKFDHRNVVFIFLSNIKLGNWAISRPSCRPSGRQWAQLGLFPDQIAQFSYFFFWKLLSLGIFILMEIAQFEYFYSFGNCLVWVFLFLWKLVSMSIFSFGNCLV